MIVNAALILTEEAARISPKSVPKDGGGIKEHGTRHNRNHGGSLQKWAIVDVSWDIGQCTFIFCSSLFQNLPNSSCCTSRGGMSRLRHHWDIVSKSQRSPTPTTCAWLANAMLVRSHGDAFLCALTRGASRDKIRCEIFLSKRRLHQEPLALRYLMIGVSHWCPSCLLMRSTFEATSGGQGLAEGSNFLQGDPGNFAQILHDPVVLWIGSVPLLP